MTDFAIFMGFLATFVLAIYLAYLIERKFTELEIKIDRIRKGVVNEK